MAGVIQARRIGLLLGAVLVVLAAVVLAGRIAADRALDRIAARAAVTASLRSALLGSEIARFRLLPVTLSDDRDVIAALTGSAPARAALDTKLEGLARSTGAAAIYVIDGTGHAISASNYRTGRSFVGQDYRFRAYYRSALRYGRATQFALGTISRRPGLYLAHRSGGGGVIVVKQEFDPVEADWRHGDGATFVRDPAGTILITTRPGWRFRPAAGIVSAPDGRHRATLLAGTGPDAREMLLTSVPARDFGWRLDFLVPIRAEVAAAAALARTIALLASLALLAALWAWRERGRRRAERIAAASARTTELEATVSARTAQLRHEMDERARSEARAAELREGLRQANRLASLGQITAGLAHETAQPVAAIRSYAANGRRFLERGDETAADANFAAIGRLAERIGAITTGLRDFARKATGAVAPMPLAAAFDGVGLILRDRLSRIALDWPTVPPDLLVLAEPVRLEQVLVNLLQNAVEALEGAADPHVAVTLATEADAVRIRVADNGPGIDPAVAARIFTPFVTTRAAGLGLGLVISSDIMTDLGGHLRWIEGDGGACFEIGLKRAPPCSIR